MGRGGQDEETNCFHYGINFLAGAVNLAVHPITDAPVVDSVVPAPEHDRNISDNNVFHYSWRHTCNTLKPDGQR